MDRAPPAADLAERTMTLVQTDDVAMPFRVEDVTEAAAPEDTVTDVEPTTETERAQLDTYGKATAG